MLETNNSFMRTMTSGNFLAGLMVGGLTTLVLTNTTVQRALLITAAKTTSMVKGGLAEAKERFHDAEAEVHLEGGEEHEAK